MTYIQMDCGEKLKFEHRIWSASKKLNVKFYWVSGNEIKEVKLNIYIFKYDL